MTLKYLPEHAQTTLLTRNPRDFEAINEINA